MRARDMQTGSQGRAGFTLVELMIVVAIIAVLMSLVAAAVFKAMSLIPQVQTVNEIQQLTVAMESFKLKYGSYPPSRILLSNDPNDYASDPTSEQYLRSLWQALDLSQVDWTGQGSPGNQYGGVLPLYLEGDQCLVYFLRGPTGTGWSTNPSNPTQAGGTRAGPFFEFVTDRLVSVHGNPFVSYADPYRDSGQYNVYAFFCSNRRNGYNDTDCKLLGVKPYYQLVSGLPRYYNPNTFQIVSAGKNYRFGPGGEWSPGLPAASYGSKKDGFDDLSNFHGELLGVP